MSCLQKKNFICGNAPENFVAFCGVNQSITLLMDINDKEIYISLDIYANFGEIFPYFSAEIFD